MTIPVLPDFLATSTGDVFVAIFLEFRYESSARMVATPMDGSQSTLLGIFSNGKGRVVNIIDR